MNRAHISRLVLGMALGIGAVPAIAQQRDAQQPDSSRQQGAKQDQKSDKKASGQLERSDAQAMRAMAEANLAEVHAGKAAAEKASSDEVKKFAQHMVDDHGKQLEELQSLAAKKGVELPTEPSKKHQAAMKKLESASGEQFDRTYMQQMVRDHRDTLQLVERTAKRAKDPEVKAAAEKAAPDVRKHLQTAQQLAGSKNASAGGSKGSAGKGGAAGGGAAK